MNATYQPNAVGIQDTSKTNDGVHAHFTGARSHAVFNLGLDISPLRPRQRFVVRALLQRMSGMPLPTSPAPKC